MKQGVTIDAAAIAAKVNNYLYTSAGQKKVEDAVNKKMQTGGAGIHTPEEAAEKYISVLQAAIQNSGLSANAAGAISGLDHTGAAGGKVGPNKFEYTVTVYFTGDRSRPSLDEARYGGIDDLAELFDTGVDHQMRAVHGVWHGQEIWSRTVIPGAHFIDTSIADFMGNYSTDYNVINITVDRG